MNSRILFVCLGNICRSPAAEGVFRALAAHEGLAVLADSAGTGGWHVGEPPDPRMIAAAARRGYDLSGLRARQIARADFARFDRVLAMDRRNLRDLERIRPQGGAPLARLLDFAPELPLRDVPDPYYGGPEAFEQVLDLVEVAARGLIAALRTN
ncbi:MAG TPA: low molecular weight protein-tyrosine-phosphatase [Paracoccaceae bacterium]|nr:low molecular weight protein-tyrosine-phosphatase [Paracoccaceae bacterium]